MSGAPPPEPPGQKRKGGPILQRGLGVPSLFAAAYSARPGGPPPPPGGRASRFLARGGRPPRPASA